jgi:Dehydratase medium subunit
VIVALLAPGEAAAAGGLAAGCEEEGVPLDLRIAGDERDAHALARAGARESPLGLGAGGAGGRLVLVLAAAPGHPYLEAPASEARAFGHAISRIAARRPLPCRT